MQTYTHIYLEHDGTVFEVLIISQRFISYSLMFHGTNELIELLTRCLASLH